MELWKLNIIAVLVIAFITRKDMAVLAGAFMFLGYLVTLGEYSQVKASLLFCALNCLLAIISASYSYIEHCRLSIVTSCIAALATFVNLCQVYDISALSSTITSVMGWFLVLALVFMDGGKGIISGFIRDFNDCSRRFVRGTGRISNNKGRD